MDPMLQRITDQIQGRIDGIDEALDLSHAITYDERERLSCRRKAFADVLDMIAKVANR